MYYVLLRHPLFTVARLTVLCQLNLTHHHSNFADETLMCCKKRHHRKTKCHVTLLLETLLCAEVYIFLLIGQYLFYLNKQLIYLHII